MPMWRCPHCGTPQQEAARCWVCRRSSTICSTCRHFRASLAASVGYCGLDRRRAPLTGTELRGCWTARAVQPSDAPPPAPPPAANRLRLPPRSQPGILEGFVPVELPGAGPRTLGPLDPVPAPPAAIIEASEAIEGWASRDSLFGDAEP